MKISEMMVHVKLISDVIRTVKCGLDDVVFTTNEPNKVFVVNAEGSVIYVVTVPSTCSGWLPNKIHVAGPVKNFVKVMEYCEDQEQELAFDNILFDAFNPWLYPTTLNSMRVFCESMHNSLMTKITTAKELIDSDDIITDPYYDFVINDLFNKGTGVSDIITSKTGKPITLYKGLLPYTSKDKIGLSTFDIGNKNFIVRFAISKIKPTKSSLSVDMYVRCLDILA